MHERTQARRAQPAASERSVLPSGGGRPLEAQTRARMESQFGHDFGRVRVHSDREAQESALALGARAYTRGQDVVFGAGEYAPESELGQRLLAHELTHVVQQTAGPPAESPLIQRDLLPKWRLGDWEILPPKPTTKTDDRYDNQQNRDRAERKEEDARSGDKNPYEWWKPATPPPAPDPNDKLDPLNWPKTIKTPPEELPPLPPPAPNPKGDFPTLPVEPGDGQYA